MIFWGYYFAIHTKRKEKKSFNQGVSVIICAHNEYINLKKFLPLFLNQQYHLFEVIIVNDRSNDDTDALLNRFKKSYTHLKTHTITQTPKSWNPKKWALSQGASLAQFDYLLFSDADCYPSSPSWIKLMSNGFCHGNAVVGYADYTKSKSLLNAFIQFETYLTGTTYLGLANKGINYMATGRNFGIKKELYVKFNFGVFKNVQGGDDDLLINHVKLDLVAINDPASKTISVPKTRIKDYLKQKLRHVNIAKHYTLKNKLLIGTFNLSSLLFYLCFFIVFFDESVIKYAIGTFVFRTSILFYSFALGTKYLEVKINFICFLLLDFVYTIYLWTFGPIALIAKKIKWK